MHTHRLPLQPKTFVGFALLSLPCNPEGEIYADLGFGRSVPPILLSGLVRQGKSDIGPYAIAKRGWRAMILDYIRPWVILSSDKATSDVVMAGTVAMTARLDPVRLLKPTGMAPGHGQQVLTTTNRPEWSVCLSPRPTTIPDRSVSCSLPACGVSFALRRDYPTKP
jgi:hypothetical protein